MWGAVFDLSGFWTFGGAFDLTWKGLGYDGLGLVGYSYLYLLINVMMGRDSSVVIATRYGLDDPGIESRCGQDFPHPSRPTLGPTHSSIQWLPVLYSGGKAAGAWR
jgi:hypothetical protein